MMRSFPLFIDMIRNVELALAKADFGVARLYSTLVEDEALRDRVYTLLEEEFSRTRRMVLAVTEQQTLLQRNPVLANSIRLRNPYVDPMSLLQLELLTRKRTSDSNDPTSRRTPPSSTAPSPPRSTASAQACATQAEIPATPASYFSASS